MEQVWIPLLSVLVGAVIGSLAPIISIFVQTRAARRREIQRLVVDSAVAEYEGRIQLLVASGEERVIYPLGSYIFYFQNLLETLDRGKLTPETYHLLKQKQSEVTKIITTKIPD